MANEEDRERSEFNDSLGYLRIINIVQQVIISASMELNASDWFHGILAFARLLSTEMNEDEKENIPKFRDKTRLLLQPYLKKLSQGQTQISPALYNALFDYEMELRDILKTSGLQQKLKEFDPRKDKSDKSKK